MKMSYEVKVGARMGARLQRVAEEQVRGAIEELSLITGGEMGRPIHEARKHLKRLRALLRLARADLDAAMFREANNCFRKAGNKLTESRETQVLSKTLDALRRRFFDNQSPPVFGAARKLFVARERKCIRSVVEGGIISEVITDLSGALDRIGAWDLKGFGWKEARSALKRSYKRARTTFQTALDAPGIENLHQWRKRVKDLCYHARLLRKACPERMQEFEHELDILAEFLGDDHDLALLANALSGCATELGEAVDLEGCLKLIEVRRQELQAAAFALGERLYAEAPSV
jgi:CHAD domain-containing protein